MIMNHKELQDTLQIKHNSKMIAFLEDRGIAFMLDGQGKCITSHRLLEEQMLHKRTEAWEFEGG